MNLANITTKEAKMLFAAHLFLHTSRDGMVISNITKVSPYNLHKMTKSPNWRKCLRFWNYKGDPTIRGELYHEVVKRSEEKNSLNIAFRLWKEVFGIKPVNQILRFFGK